MGGLIQNASTFGPTQATQTGEFEIACAERCGLGHYRRRGRVIGESPEEFNTWLAEVKAKQSGGN